MKKYLLVLLLPLMAIGFSSCDGLLGDDGDVKDSLYVKFKNESASEYTITKIQVRKRGKVESSLNPTTTWSNNLLENSETLAPGEHFFFTLDIPKGEWAEYRLGVNNGNGVEVMLYDQSNYDGYTDLPITHWGSDDRTVTVTIGTDDSTGNIEVTGWSDWAGIQE